MDSKKFYTNKKVILLLATFCCVLWGSAYPAIKNGYILFNISAGNLPAKMLFAGYRFFLAGIIVLIIALITKKNIFAFTKKNVLHLILLGLTQTSIQYIFFYIGLAYTTGVKGSIMNATGTFFSVILAHFIYTNDRLNAHKILGCLIGFCGVLIINFSNDLLKFSFTLKGEGFVILSAFMLSASSIYGKKITQTLDSMLVTGYQLAIGGLFLIAVGYISHGSISGFTFSSSLLLFYLALLSSVAFSLWTALLKYNKVGKIYIFNFLVPVFGSILSAIFLGENILEFKNAIALVLVCFGIWFVNRVE